MTMNAMDLIKQDITDSNTYEAGRKAGIRSGMDYARDVALANGYWGLADKIKKELKNVK